MKIAFAGTGYINKIHAKAALAAGVELVAVVNHHPDSMSAFAAEFNIPNQYRSVEALLEDCTVDALVVSTPNYLHASQTIAALNAGVHVMVEKPMALNAHESESMCDAAVQSGALLMVAHCWRFNEDVMWLRHHASQLGKIVRTRGVSSHTNWGPSGWFTQREFAGGGSMADMGIHAVDTIRFLLGDPNPVSVYAKLGTYYDSVAGQKKDVDDTGVLIVEWEGGTVSTIETGWWQPSIGQAESSAQLYGEKGFGQIGFGKANPTRLILSREGHRTGEIVDSNLGFSPSKESHQHLYDQQMQYFVDCINSNKIPVPGGTEGLINMRIVDAAYQSSKAGDVIKF